MVYRSSRLGITLLASLGLHALLILGLGLSLQSAGRNPSSLEVTLVRQPGERPERADLLAQEDQAGAAEHGRPFPESTASAPVPVAAPTAAVLTREPAEPALEPSPLLSLTVEGAQPIQWPSPAQAAATVEEPDGSDPWDQLEAQREARSSRMRRHSLTAAAAHQQRNALYLEDWRRKIEAVGNQHYPRQAEAQGIYGSLRLLVALRADGSLEEVRLLRSSGHAVLDQAAIRTVMLAAPFAPFPPAMRVQMDVLDIIRTWQFHPDGGFLSD